MCTTLLFPMIQPEVHWLKLLGRWLLRTAPLPSKPLIVYERRAGNVLDSKLSLLPDGDSRYPQRPGAVATWKLVDRQEPRIAVFVTLDNLLRLASESKQVEIHKGLQRSQGLTHRFQASWVTKSTAGKFHFVVIEAFDVDLSNQYIDEAPREIIRHLVLEVFNMRPVEGLNWRDRIYHFPWLDTIQYFAPKKGCPEHPRYRRLCKRIQKVTFS